MKEEARKKALLHMKKMMTDMMAEPLEGLKGKKMMAVKVASDSPEGVVKGLDKAKEMMAKRAKDMGYDKEDEMCPECGKEPCECEGEEKEDESPAEEAKEDMAEEMPLEQMSKEQLIEMIKKMQ